MIPDVGDLHLTPASSSWRQLCFPSGLARQSMSLFSLPVHATSSSQIGPVPARNLMLLHTAWSYLHNLRSDMGTIAMLQYNAIASYYMCIPVEANPNCLQITKAVVVVQPSSQTVPQVLLMHTSTRPSYMFDPPTNRRAPLVGQDTMSDEVCVYSSYIMQWCN